MQNTTYPIDTLIADGGYNTLGVYYAAYEKNIPHILIPPTVTRKPPKKAHPAFEPYIKALEFLRAYSDPYEGAVETADRLSFG